MGRGVETTSVKCESSNWPISSGQTAGMVSGLSTACGPTSVAQLWLGLCNSGPGLDHIW